ncbi:hypothetical protein LTS10_005873 [Elasticomyces elasticus]|nr:hypothetical protein LTS10_005873 [Elasticomyces elasticus]
MTSTAFDQVCSRMEEYPASNFMEANSALQRDCDGKDFIRLDDDDPITLGLLLDFMYTSRYNEPLGLEAMEEMQMSLNVYKLAEKYKVPNLCSVATQRLSDAVMVSLEQNEVNTCIETLR